MKSAWSTDQAPGKLGLHRDPISETNQRQTGIACELIAIQYIVNCRNIQMCPSCFCYGVLMTLIDKRKLSIVIGRLGNRPLNSAEQSRVFCVREQLFLSWEFHSV